MVRHRNSQVLHTASSSPEELDGAMRVRNRQRPLILDVGGEGRYSEAWNVNPSAVKTLGRDQGQPIPRRIAGRAEAIPLPDKSADIIIVERSPLRVAALHEIARVITTDGVIILRHACLPNHDPHSFAKRILPGTATSRIWCLGERVLQETEFHLSLSVASPSVDGTMRGKSYVNQDLKLPWLRLQRLKRQQHRRSSTEKCPEE